MVKVTLIDRDGAEWTPRAIWKLVIEVDEGAPADSLYAEFPYTACPESVGVRVFSDGVEVFCGVVDEEEHVSDNSGETLRISARSKAALLLDNEAAPCGYDHPSAALMYERYAKPFGITLSETDDAVYFGEQSVLKGASCYSVLKNFCTACYSSLPRVSGTGALSLKGMMKEDETRFGNGEGEVRFLSLSESRKRCEEISEVIVKTSDSGGYALPIKNQSALSRGIVRRRYLNATLNQSPMRCADAMIANGQRKAYSIKLRCPSCLLGHEGDRARVNSERIALPDDLYISALRYRLTAGGEYTDVTLKRRMNGCG